MRTDRPDRSADGERSGTGDAPAASAVSRRAFVLGTGAFAGAVVGGTARGDSTQVDVAATEPYRRWAAAAGRSFERATDASARLRTADRTDVDVHVSGRPTLPPAETDRVTSALVSGWGFLDGDEWRDPLRRPAVRDRWAAETPVETWSESDESSVAAVGRALDSAVPGPTTAGWTALVRGSRSYQYSHGRGGVGYYDVDRNDLTADPDAAVPLLRLAYVHVDEPSDDAVAAFLASCRRRGPDGAALASFTDPAVDDR